MRTNRFLPRCLAASKLATMKRRSGGSVAPAVSPTVRRSNRQVRAPDTFSPSSPVPSAVASLSSDDDEEVRHVLLQCGVWFVTRSLFDIALVFRACLLLWSQIGRYQPSCEATHEAPKGKRRCEQASSSTEQSCRHGGLCPCLPLVCRLPRRLFCLCVLPRDVVVPLFFALRLPRGLTVN